MRRVMVGFVANELLMGYISINVRQNLAVNKMLVAIVFGADNLSRFLQYSVTLHWRKEMQLMITMIEIALTSTRPLVLRPAHKLLHL